MAEATTADDPTTRPDVAADQAHHTTRQAWVVVLTLVALTAAFILTLAFSTHNTEFSVEGESATTAKIVEPAGP